jgi:hypothetical protein
MNTNLAPEEGSRSSFRNGVFSECWTIKESRNQAVINRSVIIGWEGGGWPPWTAYSKARQNDKQSEYFK